MKISTVYSLSITNQTKPTLNTIYLLLLLFLLHTQTQATNQQKIKLKLSPSLPLMEQGSSLLDGFATASSPPLLWKSRRRSANSRSSEKATGDETLSKEEIKAQNKEEETSVDEKMQEPASELSERRKALFEPLEPIMNVNGKRLSAESLLPPPDFETASYPRGWLVGKKRKLVNVDVVESMRRIAVQEMNRKDREIDGLNEQLEEDARCLEHLQLQLLQERSKRSEVERDNAMLQDQISMLMNMLQENDETIEEEEEGTNDETN